MEPSNDDNILEVVAVLGATQMVSKFLVCYASQYVSVHSNSTQKELSLAEYDCPFPFYSRVFLKYLVGCSTTGLHR